MRKQEVHGNLEGLRDSVIAQLGMLYEAELDEDQFLSHDLCRFLAQMTGVIRREIAVYITRDGDIVEVMVGTDRDV